MNQLYDRPKEYDLEHLGDDEDVRFYTSLVQKFRPRNILELGCGTGRITIPLAEQAGRAGYRIVGLDSQVPMLKEARARLQQLPEAVRERVDFVAGDMRNWSNDARFDLIFAACSSISHLLDLNDQLATWQRAYANLAEGGRFVVEVTMPNLATFADSFRAPPRELVEVDIDNFDPGESVRLIRRKTTRYLSDNQRAQIRFLYEKYRDGRLVESYLDDFASHVFFPRELKLLFMYTGFEIEQMIGDYKGKPISSDSRIIVSIGRKNLRRHAEN